MNHSLMVGMPSFCGIQEKILRETRGNWKIERGTQNVRRLRGKSKRCNFHTEFQELNQRISVLQSKTMSTGNQSSLISIRDLQKARVNKKEPLLRRWLVCNRIQKITQASSVDEVITQ